MRKIKSAIIGAGYISRLHIDAIKRVGNVDILAINDVDYNLAKKKVLEYSIPNCYRDLDELLSNKEIDVVHNCTPNYLHFDINRKIIRSEKHAFFRKTIGFKQ